MVPSFHPAKNNEPHMVAKTIFSRRWVASRDVDLSPRAASVAIDGPPCVRGLSSAGVALEEGDLVGGYECSTGYFDGIFEAVWVIVVVADIMERKKVGGKCDRGENVVH